MAFILPIISLTQIIGLMFASINICIFAPITLFYCMKFYKQSTLIRMKHKNKKVIFFMMAFSLFGFIIERPLVIACNTWHINNKFKSFPIPLWIVTAINSIYIALLFAINSLYLWLLFYNKNHQIALAGLPWQRQVNPRYRSWYILNRNKFGNPLYLSFIFTIPFCIYILFELLLEYVFYIHSISTYSFTLLSVIFTIPAFILYVKIRQQSSYLNSDMYDGSKESYYQCIIFALFIIIYSLSFICETGLFCYLSIFRKTNPNISHIKMTRNFIYIITEFTTSFVLFISCFITIYTAYAQTKAICTPLNLYATRRNSACKPSETKYGVGAMLRTIATFQGFNAFMQHLTKEWAAENLIFILELISIKCEYQNENIYFDASKQSETSVNSNDPQSIVNIHRLTPEMTAQQTPTQSTSALSLNLYDSSITSVNSDAEEEYPSIYDDQNVIEFSKPALEPIKSGVELAMKKIKSVSSAGGDYSGERSTRGSKRNSLRLHKRASSIKFYEGITSYLHNMDGSVWSEINLPSGLPKSEVLNTKITLIEQFYDLYFKYIKSGCEQEVNIAYFQRKHISDTLEAVIKNKNQSGAYGKMLEEQMFGLMDAAAIEILILLCDAYRRFAVSPAGKARV